MTTRIAGFVVGAVWVLCAAALLYSIVHPTRLAIVVCLGGWTLCCIAFSYRAFCAAMEGE
jgi:hypothetical protein